MCVIFSKKLANNQKSGSKKNKKTTKSSKMPDRRMISKACRLHHSQSKVFILFRTNDNYFLTSYIYLCDTVFISILSYPTPLAILMPMRKASKTPTKKEITLKYGYLLLQHFLQEYSNASYNMRATISLWYLSYVVSVPSPD